MREIKFRAYDRIDERIYYDVIPFGEFVVLKYSQAGYEMLDIEIEDYDLIYSEDFSDYEIMQYTGLKDKNGTEIYAGDIVRVTDDDGSTDFADGGIGTVGGMDELFMWYIDGDVHNGLYDIETTAYIEVIGNEWENPELLKEQNK